MEQLESRAIDRYHLKVYPGNGILLRTRLQKPEYKAEPLLGWAILIAELKVIAPWAPTIQLWKNPVCTSPSPASAKPLLTPVLRAELISIWRNGWFLPKFRWDYTTMVDKSLINYLDPKH